MVKLNVRFYSICQSVLLISLLAGCNESTYSEQKRNENPVIGKRQPNVIVIFTDDQGYEDVGVFGGDHVLTPNLDKMAEEGLMLTDFYVPSPLCSPSRAGLMTGSYPRRVDMATGSNFPVLLAADTKGLNPAEITIAEVLKSVGYATGIFGKWHLGDQPEFLPTRQGFDEFFGLPYSHDIAPTHKRQAHFKFPDLPLMENENVIELNPNPEYLTRRITERAIDFIERHQDAPFFLYLPHPMPHGPLHVSQEFLNTVDKATLARLNISDADIAANSKKAMYPLVIGELDNAVGNILDTLKRLNLDSNTIVIFTSDNGPSGRRNSDGTERYLSGHKTLTQEGGMRVPTVVWGPSQIPANTVSQALTTSMDILPTVAFLAGADVPTDRVIDGKNIWPILAAEKDAESPHDAFYYYSRNTLEAVRKGTWKLAIKGKSPGLYNLQNDPAERIDLSTEHPQKVAELKGLMERFEAELGIDETGECAKCRPAAFVANPTHLTLNPTK
ncbi:sulfatase family protein [Aliiglaciecola lipolytica]|uniref:Arylsulfatase n=1 Tax=Aliiglaciecola lipolytica E3 TaxID=1127673 RepID=K6Y6I2_9ALTE|nr:sulfatase [Aliiglaciecola lipolytica]GAC13807.1 arylsulfatase [Aliiglaciecola lipolytica E3]